MKRPKKKVETLPLQDTSATWLADSERGIVEVLYVCTECGDTNTERLFADKPIPAALNCVKCHAGFGRELGEMIARHLGMFPTKESVGSALAC